MQQRPAPAGTRTATATRRTPIERPVVGLATPRRVSDDVRPVRIIYRPTYYPTAYGYGYGPWGYRGSYLDHGYWYSPFGYSYRPGYGYGYGYSGYYGYRHNYGYPSGGYYDDNQDGAPVRQPVGSIRFRVSPNHARIYVDGALVGTVDDFDGLNDHLQLSPGPHSYELRADGYRTHSGVVMVVLGQTRTERVVLKR